MLLTIRCRRRRGLGPKPGGVAPRVRRARGLGLRVVGHIGCAPPDTKGRLSRPLVQPRADIRGAAERRGPAMFGARRLGAAGGTFEPERRLECVLGYGVASPTGFTGMPNVGHVLSNGVRDHQLGWQLTPAPGSAGRVRGQPRRDPPKAGRCQLRRIDPDGMCLGRSGPCRHPVKRRAG